jgi:hypothetical protein
MRIKQVVFASFLLLLFNGLLHAEESPLWAKNAINYFYKLGARNDSIQKHHKYYGDIIYTKVNNNLALIVFKDEDDKKILEFSKTVLKGYYFIYKKLVISSTVVVSDNFIKKAKVLYPLVDEP